VFFLLDPGPCRYYPWFFPLYDDIKHPKNHQFWWLEMALEALAAAAMVYFTDIVAAEISAVAMGTACSIGGYYCDG
jgi:hypothetical protein